MKWGRKHHLQNSEEKKKKPSSPPCSSIFSLSCILPLSCFSKLKQHKTTKPPNSQPAAKLKRSTTPIPKPLFSPPPLPPPPDRTRCKSDHLSFSRRRISVGEDDTLLARSRKNRTKALAHHNSVGELEFRSYFELAELNSRSDIDPILTRRRRRRRRPRKRRIDPDPISTPPLLKPIETNVQRRMDPDPISNGRRSFSGKVRPKVRVCSPRAARRRVEEEERGLESFAVLKSSSDPFKDFRESMVEMIWEKGIVRPEELESLLACYLSLNSDEHQDVIVKVFRQVWFDLNREADRLRLLLPRSVPLVK